MIHLYTNSEQGSKQVHSVTPSVEKSCNHIVKATDVAMTITGAGSDFSVYEGQKTVEEVIGAMGNPSDVQTNRNYMTIMSNTMSDEDFKTLVKEGYSPGDMIPETAVTVLDEIKVRMAESGVVIAGYNDDISREVLVEITGSESGAIAIENAFAKADLPINRETAKGIEAALNQAAGVEEITDGMCDYVLRNGIDPTLEHLYRVRFCGTQGGVGSGGYYSEEISGYYSLQAGEVSMEHMQKRLEEVIREAGLPVEETTLKEAGWLVENGIFLNATNISKLHGLKAIKLPMTMEGLGNAMANAVARGNKPTECYLNETEGILEKSLKIVVSARVTEETRLMLTAATSYRMMREGIVVDTGELSQTVEALKQVEAERLRALFGPFTENNREASLAEASRKAALWSATNDRLVTLALAPAAVAGRCVGVHSEISLSYVCETAEELTAKYREAGMRYEVLSTEVRMDLGDSIQKAFAGSDELLKELSLECNEANRRTLRILGYNRMEVTIENFEEVSAKDSMLQRLIRKMTPATTLRLIREGINPLECSVETLEAAVDEYYREPEKESETYSRFLFNLERKGEITAGERDAYIGIYRLLHQIEKSDGAALGSLIHSGAQLTFKNLLTAVRTGKRTGLDYTIDDSVGARLKEAGYSFDISTQILKGFEEVAIGNEGDREAYNRELQTEMQNALSLADEETLETLLSFGEKPTADAVEAMSNLMAQSRPRSGKKSVWEVLQSRSEILSSYDAEMAESLRKELETMPEALNGKEEFADKLSTMKELAEEVLEKMYLAEETERLDLRAMHLSYKQISIMGSMAKEESYEVPVSVNGSFVGVRVKIVHKKEEAGSVSASFYTENYGCVVAGFTLQDGVVNGYIASDSREGIAKLETEKKFEKALTEQNRQIGDLRYLFSESLDASFFYKRHDALVADETSTAQLYALAKAFVTSVAE